MPDLRSILFAWYLGIHEFSFLVEAVMGIRDVVHFLSNGNLSFELGFRHILKSPHYGFHSHGAFELVYHVKGDGVFSCETGEAVRFEERSVVIHPPRSRHSQTTRVPAEDACIHFNAPDNLSEAFGGYFILQSLDDATLANEILNLAEIPSPVSSLEKSACNHTISAIIAKLLVCAETPDRRQTGSTPPTDYASAAFAYIRENLAAITDMEQVARELGISYDHLRHVFRKKFGTSMKERMSAMRLEKSRRLLAQTSLPLKAIAAMAGYTSDRYFCMAFKAVEGMTPGGYRRLKSR